MLGKLPSESQPSVFAPSFELMLNPNHELVLLAKKLDWDDLERRFAGLYASSGRPSIPVRVVVSLIMLQRMKNLSDEEVVKQVGAESVLAIFQRDGDVSVGVAVRSDRIGSASVLMGLSRFSRGRWRSIRSATRCRRR
jgi:hypothetical protein